MGGTKFVDPCGLRIGDYRIQRPIAWGGMGIVYLAENPLAGTRVAAKVLREEFAVHPALAKRFREEAIAAVQVRHPNTVHVYDLLALADGRPCILMEYLEGETLERRAGTAPMPFERARPILLQICGALEATHARGIVHRDLKAENVFLLCREGRDDFVKLLDFGLARSTAAAAGVSLPGTVAGTPYYMAPEQIRGDKVDARTDLYALGVLTVRLLTARFPFPGQGVEEVMHKQLAQPPDLGEIRGPLRAVLARALEKRREARWSSAAEMARAFVECPAEATAEDGPDPWLMTPETPAPFPRPAPPPPKPAVPPPPVAPPGREATGARRPTPPARDPLAQLLERYLERSDRDHYAFLGLSEAAEAAEVRLACSRVEAELLEARRVAGVAQRAQLSALLGRLDRARQALDSLDARAAHDARRANYRGVASSLAAGLSWERLERLHEEYSAHFPDRAARAAELARAADELQRAGDPARAAEALAQALGVDPLSPALQREWARRRR